MQSGVQTKPSGCNLCPLSFSGTGFCPDNVPQYPKLMLLLETPYSDDVLYQRPLSGKMGDFLENSIIKPSGLKRDDLLIAHVLRCKVKDYPTAKNKRLSEEHCRRYDTGIKQFHPSLFVITFGVDDTFSDSAYTALMINDFKRAKWLTTEYPDEKICILAGREAVNLVTKLPFEDGKGGIKSWRGSYFKSKWNY